MYGIVSSYSWCSYAVNDLIMALLKHNRNGRASEIHSENRFMDSSHVRRQLKTAECQKIGKQGMDEIMYSTRRIIQMLLFILYHNKTTKE